jgi:nitroimidazol reductase NimA-like FMN-containing flavoprotein (pyridoxamine 5'-phosphate oxidase superfamily)
MPNMPIAKADEKFILKQLDKHTVLTLATQRADGYPQATIVAFAHDGLDLYVAVDAGSQKAKNIRRNGKVSVAIGRDHRDWGRIRALSMAAQAQVLKKRADIERAQAVLGARFPQLKAMGAADHYEGWSFLRITPLVVSMLDYTQGFGHTELVDLRG